MLLDLLTPLEILITSKTEILHLGTKNTQNHYNPSWDCGGKNTKRKDILEYLIPLYFYSHITVENYNKLKSKGFYIPFDNKNPEFNTYAYAPDTTSQELFDYAESLCGKFQKLSKVPTSSVIKNITKTEETNKIKVGDWVQCKGVWKTLPLKVISIQDREAIVHCKLRGESIEETHPIEELSLLSSDELHSIEMYQVNTELDDMREKSLVIDCDSFSKTSMMLLKEFLITLIKVKLYAPEHYVIVANPEARVHRLSSYLGLKVYFGNILSLKQDMTYTQNHLLIGLLKNTVSISEGIVVKNEVDEARAYMTFKHPNHSWRKYNLFRSDVENLVTAKKWARGVIESNKDDLGEIREYKSDTKKAYEYLLDMGLGYFADGVYNTIDLLRQ